ncbi:UDP-N-acetylmuramoyl-tripeptide--D-alanyl-D-alanine ligase [Acetobacter orientalis]|uniref:UDP-N-acetylmuramoyl-tripeptide--D-alanyl-D- alanine ligase n=1 Tax=Acetobacter orientalis TaxID=146474 RepID=UPI00209CFDE5|nr:UDP-N-acetylmuramoyl-tripeptide--D-alanyl-D-alanine ligase [Acetobacter orientalis]MCP1215921.1 UDP-N-acetylmuramoyl-tripeptide--D-alanyl-D-alanine ligase [Acetobacter orientalis]MCP1217919.1 UDP-N-acetylmuramoyl-tripeptide--D-alanyl-D-alanine ligase [Acetobacter orientalis]
MTALWTRAELEAATGGHFLGACTPEVTGISIDTRTLTPGDLFIALQGDNSDGHTHIATALGKGAAAVLVHNTTGQTDPRLLVVQDTLHGLQALAAAARTRFSGKVVAITGSVGKTTTKEMLRVALSALGPTHAAEASYNNHWGVPLTLARLPQNAAFCISEIGMNHPGEILPLARMVKPDVAVISTIASAHLGHMGSLDAIAQEKATLIAALPAGGIAIVPDDAHGQRFFESAAQTAHATLWQSGLQTNSFARLSALTTQPNGSTFTAHIGAQNVAVTLNAPGAHLARNALNALAVVAAFGADLPRAAAALATFVPGKGRGALTTIAGGAITLLDESYNASATSIRATLDVLRLVPAQRHIAVLGDIRELGEFAISEHAALAPAAATCADLVFCCGPHMKSLFDALPHAKQGAWADSSASLAPLVCAALRKGDAVLVKGSLGSRMRTIIEALTGLNTVEPA